MALKNCEGLSCYLFGSYAKAKAKQSSDVDLLLLMDKKRYDYRAVHKIQDTLEDAFAKIEKYCRPIYGYVENINNDSSILFRQYIGYGVLMYGDDLQESMRQETQERLQALEYSHYWMPMYLKKMQQLEEIYDTKIFSSYGSLCWQYLFLSIYWYAKAQLTLVNKQNSLNNFTLVYIYTELLHFSLNQEEYKCLELVQRHRNNYRKGEELESENISFYDNFMLIKEMFKR